MSAEIVNVSPDLVWGLTRKNSSFLVKRTTGSHTVKFSREPLNLVNIHSRKYSGIVNDKAIGVVPGPNGGVTLLTKKDASKAANKPSQVVISTTFGPNTQPRKTYKGIVNSTAKHYYRPDLRKDAVARASAIKLSQRVKKDKPAAKPRGKKAVAAASS